MEKIQRLFIITSGITLALGSYLLFGKQPENKKEPTKLPESPILEPQKQIIEPTPDTDK